VKSAKMMAHDSWITSGELPLHVQFGALVTTSSLAATVMLTMSRHCAMYSPEVEIGYSAGAVVALAITKPFSLG
jgi:hypothetical protein